MPTQTLHQPTPLFYAHALSRRLQKNIYFKMDCHQPSGSFKIRGVGKRCQEAAAEGYRHFVIASGGNAGLAVAYAGWKMKIKTTVVVPRSTALFMQQKIKDLEAQVVVHGSNWNESNDYAQQLTKTADCIYIPPFDHPTIWEGHATVIDECAQEIAAPDAIIVAVGGGGYFCGVAQGIERNQWSKTSIITAETHGTASMHKAIKAQKLIRLDKIDSIATSLAAKKVAAKALDYALKHQVSSYTVSDRQSMMACRSFLDDTGILVEPACGAALASVYNNMEILNAYQTILVMVCGGSSLSIEAFNQYMRQE